MGHFEPRGRHYAGPPALRALEIDVLPVLVLASWLGADDAFRSLARDVHGDETRAHQLAARYARAGAGRRVIAAMLFRASTATPRELTTRLMWMGRRYAAFEHGPLGPGDARHALQQRYLARLQRGAELVARKGAGRCLQCGAYRVADTYCSSHTLEHGQRQRDKDAQRVVLRAVAEQLDLDSDGPKSRRLRRTPTR